QRREPTDARRGAHPGLRRVGTQLLHRLPKRAPQVSGGLVRQPGELGTRRGHAGQGVDPGSDPRLDSMQSARRQREGADPASPPHALALTGDQVTQAGAPRKAAGDAVLEPVQKARLSAVARLDAFAISLALAALPYPHGVPVAEP